MINQTWGKVLHNGIVIPGLKTLRHNYKDNQ